MSMLMDSDTPQMSEQDQERLEQLLGNWRLTPATMLAKLSRGAWTPAPWLMYCSTRIATGIARGNARIIISAPPRHGKTKLVSVGTSAWVLENFPRQNVILAGYGADLSVQAGREVRDLFQNNEDILHTKVRADASRVNAFLTDAGGYMFSVGLGGPITGRGAHILLIDDFIKEIKEALSPTHRQYVWDWYVTTARTRLEPGASIIIIATRWHSDDLIGRLLKAFPGQWENIVFPAECKMDGDIIGRKVGEALFPQRYNEAALRELRETLGSTYYGALYQQEPTDEGKKLAEGHWLKLVDAAPPLKDLKLIRVWDLASTEGGGDYTTGALCGYDRLNAYFYIINIVRKQLSPQGAESIVQRTAVEDGYDVEIGVEQEPGSSGKALVEHYQRTVLPGMRVVPILTANQHSKVLRAQPLLAAAEASKVCLVKGPWNETYIREFDSFPTGPYDDQVDTTSAGYTKLSGKKVFSAVWGRANPTRPARESNRAIKAATFQVAARSAAATWGRPR